MMLKYLIEKEFKQIFRDTFLPKMLLVLPIIQLLILPLAANFEMRNINVSIVDEDKSETSRKLIQKVLASNYFNLIDNYISYNDALKSIEDNSADLIFQIPTNFEKDLLNEHIAKVLIAANAVNGTKGALGSAYLSSIISNTDTNNISVINLNNKNLSYQNFMVPGIIAFLITLVCGFVTALNIVSEKEKGTIEQINVSPVKKHIFLLSKIIPFWIIGYVELTLSLIVSYLFYGLTPVGGYLTIYLFTALHLLFCTGFGLAISSISQTQQQSMFTAFFFLIIFALTSGLFTPISSMPEWAQYMTIVNPMRYFVEVLRMVFLNGSVLSDFTVHFIAISIIALFVNTLAILGYKKSE